MNFVLLPSLHKAAVVQAALIFYNHCAIEDTIGFEKNIRVQRELLEMKTQEALSLLPTPLCREVAETIRLLQGEVRKWKKDHEFLLKHIGGCCCTFLCWKMDGTINRTQTAKKLALNDNIDPKIRFTVACTYFLEDQVTGLWGRYGEIERNKKDLQATNLAVRFWVKWLQKKNVKHWNEMIDGFFRVPRFYRRNILMRVSCFYHLLSKESKQCIETFHTTKTHDDDFQMCVNKMNETERTEIFRSKSKYLRALLLCLKWPFRSLFIDMANQAIGSLGAFGFAFVLKSMLNGYLEDGHEDFHIFQTFWEMSPTEFKDEVKEKEFIRRVKKRLLGSEYIPQHFKEILKKCLD